MSLRLSSAAQGVDTAEAALLIKLAVRWVPEDVEWLAEKGEV